MGAQVRRGERSSPVVFYKEVTVANTDGEDDDGRRFLARASWVFNAARVDGGPEAGALPEGTEVLPGAVDGLAERRGANVSIGGDVAAYISGRD